MKLTQKYLIICMPLVLWGCSSSNDDQASFELKPQITKYESDPTINLLKRLYRQHIASRGQVSEMEIKKEILGTDADRTGLDDAAEREIDNYVQSKTQWSPELKKAISLLIKFQVKDAYDFMAEEKNKLDPIIDDVSICLGKISDKQALHVFDFQEALITNNPSRAFRYIAYDAAHYNTEPQFYELKIDACEVVKRRFPNDFEWDVAWLPVFKKHPELLKRYREKKEPLPRVPENGTHSRTGEAQNNSACGMRQTRLYFANVDRAEQALQSKGDHDWEGIHGRAFYFGHSTHAIFPYCNEISKSLKDSQLKDARQIINSYEAAQKLLSQMNWVLLPSLDDSSLNKETNL